MTNAYKGGLVAGIAVVALLALTLAIGSVREASAGPVGTVDTVAIDMDITGNEALSIGTIQTCAEVSPGGTFMFDIIVDAVPASNGVSGFEANIYYDQAIFQITAVEVLMLYSGTPGTVLSFSDHTVVGLPDTDGDFVVAESALGGTIEDGPGTMMRFTAQAVGTGSSVIDLNEQDVGGDGIPNILFGQGTEYNVTNVGDGLVVVGGSCTSGTPSPSPTTGPTPSPSPTTGGPTPSPSPTTGGPTPSPTPTTGGPTPSPTPTEVPTGEPTPTPTPTEEPTPTPTPTPTAAPTASATPTATPAPTCDTTLAEDASAGDTEIVVEDATGCDAGDTIDIGAGSTAEEAEIEDVDGDTITLGDGLENDHDAGESVVEVASATASPTPRPSGFPPTGGQPGSNDSFHNLALLLILGAAMIVAATGGLLIARATGKE